MSIQGLDKLPAMLRPVEAFTNRFESRWDRLDESIWIPAFKNLKRRGSFYRSSLELRRVGPSGRS
jgi:hypothetical protein